MREDGCETVAVVFFQTENGIRDDQESRGLGDVYKENTFTNSKRPILQVKRT